MKSLALLFAIITTASAEWLPLWPGTAPGAARPPQGTEKTGEGLRYTDIEEPQYEVHPAPAGTRTGQAAVIFPGGGYGMLAMGHEGKEYASWLNQRGITAILVKYRVSGQAGMGYQFPVPFLDARRAIRTVRSRAAEWEIDPAKIGVMGSSAGGHLASLCATRFADTFPEENRDAIDATSCRPDFAILLYPVISMGPLGHDGSRKNLLGASPTPGQITAFSSELQVTEKTPPVFLLTTSDDWVDCRNSLLFAAACKEKGVSATLHLFEKGGHGYGLNGKGELTVWPALLDAWLKR